jgi:hypothetical protein
MRLKAAVLRFLARVATIPPKDMEPWEREIIRGAIRHRTARQSARDAPPPDFPLWPARWRMEDAEHGPIVPPRHDERDC